MAAYRASEHLSAGYSTNYLMFGREVRAWAVLLTRPEDIRPWPRLLVIRLMTEPIWTTRPRHTESHEKLN